MIDLVAEIMAASASSPAYSLALTPLSVLGLAGCAVGLVAIGWVAGARDLRDARDNLVLARYEAMAAATTERWVADELRATQIALAALAERDAVLRRRGDWVGVN